MSETVVINPIADEILEAQKAIAWQDVSLGHMSPEDYESQWVPDIESSFHETFFSHLSEELQKEAQSNIQFAYELRHLPENALIKSLHARGVISDSLAESGLLETRFAPNRPRTPNSPYQVGGLMHVLLGDANGGLHDVDTLYDAGLAGVGHDTKVVRISEKYAGKPDIRYGQPVDVDNDGEIDRVDLKVAKGKTQFPEDWTTDEVLLAIIDVSERPAEPQDPKRPSEFTYHFGDFNGVQIRVVKDGEGKIVTAHPLSQAEPFQIPRDAA